MKITEEFTGAIVTKEMDTIHSFVVMVFDNGSLEHFENISAKRMESAAEEAKQILKENEFEVDNFFIDFEGCFSMYIGEIQDYENISPAFPSSDVPDDDDDYDSSLASYLADPSHWPD